MQKKMSLLNELGQNKELPIRIVSPDFGHPDINSVEQVELTRRPPYYFILFMIDGCTRHGVDLEEFDIRSNQLLVVRPNQVHRLPATGHGTVYFKLGFDDRSLSRLPKQFPFLLDPLQNQPIDVDQPTGNRLKTVFEILISLLQTRDTDPELILVHLNSLLTEINLAYFKTQKNPGNGKTSTWTDFQVFVEDNLTEHPSIKNIAAELAVSTDSLYQVVKQHSGLSPKEFITNRLILEARRRIRYGKSSSVKELAFELGFNDPDYFSRLFKKVTGKTIASFFKDMS
jgi:AraC-like DNA-binding protein